MHSPPPIMQPNAVRLVELRAGRDPKEVARCMNLDLRTLAALEAGHGTDRMQFNTLNMIATYYGVPIMEIIEPVPDQVAACEIRKRHWANPGSSASL